MNKEKFYIAETKDKGKGLFAKENIKKGDKIYSIQDDLSLVRNKVKNLFKGGKKEIYKIGRAHV